MSIACAYADDKCTQWEYVRILKKENKRIHEQENYISFSDIYKKMMKRS